MSGPVSAAIEAEVTNELRRQGIVVWLDKNGAYTQLVDDLAARQARGEYPFPVVGFRGSFLELLFQLEPHASGQDKQPLLIHMPGFNKDSIRRTPVLELYDPGYCFEKALDTSIREAAVGRVAPAEVDKLIAGRPTIEQADAWLASAVSGGTFGLAAALDEIGPQLLAEALAQPDVLTRRLAGDADVEAFETYTHKLTGMDETWVAAFPAARGSTRIDRSLGAFAAWILCVEYVHDLRRPPHRADLQRLRQLSPPLVKACRELVTRLRRESADAYERMADEVAAIFDDELEKMEPDDLGDIDTFREEETRVLTGAVAALLKGDWSKAKAWCEARQGERSFWLQRDQLRRWAWALVAEGAEFGATLGKYVRPLAGAQSLDEAAERYAAGAFEVDRAHRRFEQRRLALLESRLPHYPELREMATKLRRDHRAWADATARDFTAACKEYGFLPSASMQQRRLFDQIVHPLVRTGEKVAFFAIDAFRYEMATELVAELAGPGTVVDLKPRLAELPTITSVGMNVLAPVAAGGRLDIAGELEGFKTGEYTVKTPEARARTMGMRSTGQPALRLTLPEVCEADTTALTKKVRLHPLVLVHSTGIDDAGEANVGLPVFESTLRQIKAAWHHLQLAGVKNFVFTADHGFLFQDETTASFRNFGTRRDPERRHVLDDHPRAEAGMVSVSLSSLGYDGISGYLLFLEDTTVFWAPASGQAFIHGGNSPQERIIPVLTVTRKRREDVGLAEYAVEVEPQRDVAGLHRVRLRARFAKDTTTSLGFATPGTIDLAIRAVDRDRVQVVIKDVSEPAKERSGRLQVPVGDAWSDLFFGLEGPVDEQVRIEIYHPDKTENVRSASPDRWFGVSGTAPAATAPAVGRQPSTLWADNLADEGVRKVFVHIDEHKSITEAEVTRYLGSARAFRRFSLEFEQHLARLPFRVRIEADADGKRYVREGDR